jgi:hypothetical protein
VFNSKKRWPAFSNELLLTLHLSQADVFKKHFKALVSLLSFDDGTAMNSTALKKN